jgi:hypothetical protein
MFLILSVHIYPAGREQEVGVEVWGNFNGYEICRVGGVVIGIRLGLIWGGWGFINKGYEAGISWRNSQESEIQL